MLQTGKEDDVRRQVNRLIWAFFPSLLAVALQQHSEYKQWPNPTETEQRCCGRSRWSSLWRGRRSRRGKLCYHSDSTSHDYVIKLFATVDSPTPALNSNGELSSSLTSSNLSTSLSDHEQRPGVPPPPPTSSSAHRHEVIVTDADLRSMCSQSRIIGCVREDRIRACLCAMCVIGERCNASM